MNGTNQNQSLGKSELRYYFIRLTIYYYMVCKESIVVLTYLQIRAEGKLLKMAPNSKSYARVNDNLYAVGRWYIARRE